MTNGKIIVKVAGDVMKGRESRLEPYDVGIIDDVKHFHRNNETDVANSIIFFNNGYSPTPIMDMRDDVLGRIQKVLALVEVSKLG